MYSCIVISSLYLRCALPNRYPHHVHNVCFSRGFQDIRHNDDAEAAVRSDSTPRPRKFARGGSSGSAARLPAASAIRRSLLAAAPPTTHAERFGRDRSDRDQRHRNCAKEIRYDCRMPPERDTLGIPPITALRCAAPYRRNHAT